jgi:hypothetical protein
MGVGSKGSVSDTGAITEVYEKFEEVHICRV